VSLRSDPPNPKTFEKASSQALAISWSVIASWGAAIVVMLTIAAAWIVDSERSDIQKTTDIALAGAVALAAWFACIPAIRKAFAGMRAVKSALGAAAEGRVRADELRLNAKFGVEAAGLNTLLAELERLRDQVSAKTVSTLAGGSSIGDNTNAGALDGLWLGVLVLDSQGRVEYANGAAAVTLGRRRETLAGSTIDELVTCADSAKVLRDAVVQRKRATVEVTGDTEHHERTVFRMTVKPLRRGDVGATMMLIEDVTQQRVADESRNAFVTQATHDLRTPLTNIRLYLETLTDQVEADAGVRAKCLNVINGEVRRLERIVSDMLSVSEIEAGSLSLRNDDVHPAAMFEDIEADFKAQAEDKEITLKFDLPPKLVNFSGDRDKLTSVLHNLIGNALKYTPAGGTVSVQVEQSTYALSVAVSDNGIGIDAEECELIFERFYRSRDRRVSGITGSGLGLALARRIARLHGGDVTVKSAPDKGSTFTLSLPSGAAPAQFKRAA